jgi:hypothetical protein
MIADALTKIVLALEKDSTQMLSKFDAEAHILYPDSTMIQMKGRCR